MISQAFNNKLSAAEVRKGRGLSSKSNSPEAVEESSTGNADDNEEGADNKEGAVNEEDPHNEKEKKGEGVKTKKKGGKSEYELTREANIVRNKKLLRKAMEKYQIESTKKGDKGKSGTTKEKESVREEQGRSSAPLQGLR